MATTTFSGPIKAGTISNTTGTTVGTDIKNIGYVVMAQTFSLDYSNTTDIKQQMLSSQQIRRS